jgi:hypothetical protein
MFRCGKQASHISEGAAEIRINSQPCKGINLTTEHTQTRRAPRVTIVHDTIKEMIRAHLTLVHVFHTIPHTGPMHHPFLASMRYGSIDSISAIHEATTFAGPHEYNMHQYITKACSFRPN